MDSGIYCIENLTTHKKYIGQSNNIHERWYHHKSMLKNNTHGNPYLQNAWNKYGENDFVFNVLEYCDANLLDDKEIYYIELYNTLDRQYGYNAREGGNTCVFTEETKQKMSKTHKIKCQDETERKKLQQIAIDSWANDEYREKRCGENHPMYGKHLPKEWRDKISQGNKGKKVIRTQEQVDKWKETYKMNNHKPANRIDLPIECVETGMIFNDVTEAMKYYNASYRHSIMSVCTGVTKSYKGLHFKFAENNNGK